LFNGPSAHAELDNIDFGGDFLFEYFWGDDFDLNNAFQDEVDFLRTEFHLWFQADLDDNIMVRIALESDRALNQMGTGNTNILVENGLGDLEIFVDEAYIAMADIAMSGFSASLGRQFLNYGDDPTSNDFNRWWGAGFLIGDSQPNSPLLLTQLGSHEIDPFDAVVINYETENMRIDLIHTRDMEDSVLGGPGNPTNEDATLSALYTSYYGIENHQFDLYTSYHEQDNQLGSLNFDGEKWIVGARAAGDINDSLAYKTELATQLEDRNVGPESDAFALQSGLNFHPTTRYRPHLGLLYTYLQHDGMNGAMQGFSAPFEGKIYGAIAEGLTKTIEGGMNPFTNMHVFNLNGGWEPWENVAWKTDLFYFLLDEAVAGSNEGGFEIDSQVDYRFNDYLTTFFGGGMFFPGEAFDNTQGDDDDSAFVRAGVHVNF